MPKQFRNTNYFITENGEVYHKRKSGLRLVKPTMSKDGYYKFGLFDNGVRTFYRAHRLVAECFIINPNKFEQVNHLNGIKTDNRVENLEWCNASQNQIHAYKTKLQKSGEKHHMSKLTYEDIQWIKNNYIYKDSEYGSTSLGKKFGVNHGQILRIVKNKQWKYAEK